MLLSLEAITENRRFQGTAVTLHFSNIYVGKGRGDPEKL